MRSGGYRGRWGEPSLRCIEDMPDEYRRFVARGREILHREDWWRFFYLR